MCGMHVRVHVRAQPNQSSRLFVHEGSCVCSRVTVRVQYTHGVCVCVCMRVRVRARVSLDVCCVCARAREGVYKYVDICKFMCAGQANVAWSCVCALLLKHMLAKYKERK